MVKCISLWQPWATLMMLNLKKYETRGWPTKYRGPLAIHAAKKWGPTQENIALSEPFRSALAPTGWPLKAPRDCMPFGAIIGTVQIVDCVVIHEGNVPAGLERCFGDYAPDRFMWRTVDPKPLSAPVLYRGAQGLFEIPKHLLEVEAV